MLKQKCEAATPSIGRALYWRDGGTRATERPRRSTGRSGGCSQSGMQGGSVSGRSAADLLPRRAGPSPRPAWSAGSPRPARWARCAQQGQLPAPRTAPACHGSCGRRRWRSREGGWPTGHQKIPWPDQLPPRPLAPQPASGGRVPQSMLLARAALHPRLCSQLGESSWSAPGRAPARSSSARARLPGLCVPRRGRRRAAPGPPTPPRCA
mmetsp:Transcript_11196/g.43185  ORF Transcript_11196/g.43185 Transcript_11196/m.43185 type:complete len:209 (+) Transcript_11196:163-789(+)